MLRIFKNAGVVFRSSSCLLSVSFSSRHLSGSSVTVGVFWARHLLYSASFVPGAGQCLPWLSSFTLVVVSSSQSPQSFFVHCQYPSFTIVYGAIKMLYSYKENLCPKYPMAFETFQRKKICFERCQRLYDLSLKGHKVF